MQYKEITVPSSEILSICEKVLSEIESSYLICEEIKKERRDKLEQFRTDESIKFERYREIHGDEKATKHEHYRQITYADFCKSYIEFYNPLERQYNSVKSLIAATSLSGSVKMDQEQVDNLLKLKDIDTKQIVQEWIACEPDFTSRFSDEDFVEPKKPTETPTTETRKIFNTEYNKYILIAAIIVWIVLDHIFIVRCL